MTDDLTEAAFFAAKNGSTEILHRLLAEGIIPISIVDKDKCTLLIRAVEGNHLETVQMLLEYVPDNVLNAKNRYGKTALHYAYSIGSRELVETLLLEDVDLFARDNYHRTAFDDGMERGYRALVTNSLAAYCYAVLPEPIEPPGYMSSTSTTITVSIRPNPSTLNIDDSDDPCRVLGYFVQVAKVSDDELAGNVSVPVRRWAISHPCFPTTTYKAKHLAPDSTYVFRICATNAFGRSPYSAESAYMSTQVYGGSRDSRATTQSSIPTPSSPDTDSIDSTATPNNLSDDSDTANDIELERNDTAVRDAASGIAVQASRASIQQDNHANPGTSMFWGDRVSRTTTSGATREGTRHSTRDSDAPMNTSAISSSRDRLHSSPESSHARTFRTTPSGIRASLPSSQRTQPSRVSSTSQTTTDNAVTRAGSSTHDTARDSGTSGTAASSNASSPSRRESRESSQWRARSTQSPQETQSTAHMLPSLTQGRARSDPYYQYSDVTTNAGVMDSTLASMLNRMSHHTEASSMGRPYDLVELANLQTELHDAKLLIEAFQADSESMAKQIQTLQEKLNIYKGKASSIDKMTLSEINETIPVLQATLENLQARKKKLEESGKEAGNVCVICLDAPKTVLVTPCNHVCFCEDCAELFDPKTQADGEEQQFCPICRTQIQGTLKIYL